jgi:hypothetical protein
MFNPESSTFNASPPQQSPGSEPADRFFATIGVNPRRIAMLPQTNEVMLSGRGDPLRSRSFIPNSFRFPIAGLSKQNGGFPIRHLCLN